MTEGSARRFWLPSFYFLFYGAGASLSPFLSVYLKDIGLSPAEIGVLLSVPPLILLVGGPVWSGFADARQRHRTLMLVAILGSILFSAAVYKLRGLAFLLPAVAVYSFFNAPIIPLADSSTLALLGDRRDEYGRIRVWGSVAWGLVGPATGFLIDRSGIAWAFIGYILLMILALPVAAKLPLEQSRLSQPFWKGMRSAFADRRWYLFLLAAAISGIAGAAVNSFLFLYMQAVGSDGTVMGLSLTVATVAQIPFFLYTNLLVRRWGARRLLLVGMILFAVRFLLYAVTSSPWIILAVQLLHGPTFAAIWVAGVSYANEISPPGLGATSQGLFSAVFFGLGAVLGGIICGSSFSAFGAHGMFGMLAVVVAAGVLVYWVADSRARRASLRPTA